MLQIFQILLFLNKTKLCIVVHRKRFNLHKAEFRNMLYFVMDCSYWYRPQPPSSSISPCLL